LRSDKSNALVLETPARRHKMDRRIDWPWDWEEEAEWKAELEERDYDFLEGLIDSAVEEDMTSSRYVVRPRQEQESAEDVTPEKYSVVA
jgi:hypothetical protein